MDLRFDWRAWWQQSVYLWVSSMGTATLQHADVVLVGLLLGDRQAALYAAASRTTQILQLAPTALTAVLIPQASRTASEEGAPGLHRLVVLHNRVVFLPVMVAASIILAAPELALSFFGTTFADAASALRILTAGHLLAILCGPLVPICVGGGWHRAYTVSTVSSVVILLSLQLALVPGLGLVGAAAASGTAVALPPIILRFWLKRRTGIDTSAWAHQTRER